MVLPVARSYADSGTCPAMKQTEDACNQDRTGWYGKFETKPCIYYPDNGQPGYGFWLNWYGISWNMYDGYTYYCPPGTPDPPANQGGCGGECPTTPMRANPVNAATGNKYQEEDDAKWNKWLVLKRYYNSDSGTSPDHMGSRWRHFYSRAVIGSLSGATVLRQDGMAARFTSTYPQRVFSSASNPNDVLTPVRAANGDLTGWILFWSSTRETESYTADGFLTSIRDADGYVTQLTYTSSTKVVGGSLLSRVIDPNGRTLDFSYDNDGNLTSVTGPDGSSYTYSYITDGTLVLLSTATYPEGSKRYTYQPSTPLLTTITDERGNSFATFGYNAMGQVVSSTHAEGANAYAFAYNSDGTTDVTTPLGDTQHLAYTNPGGVIRVASSSKPCPYCGPTYANVTYDGNGNPTKETDYRGISTTKDYDAYGEVISEVEAKDTDSQRTTETTWDTTLRLPLLRTVKDATGTLKSKQGWAYNAAGQTTAECLIDPVGAPSYTCEATSTVPTGVRRTTTTYCTSVDDSTCPLVGLPLTVDGPRTDVSDTVSYAWYTTTDESGCGTVGGACHHLGDLKSTTDGAGLVTTYVSYDKAGRITRVRDPNGVPTDYTYTPRGWLATKTVRADTSGTVSPADAITTIVYDPTGTVHAVQDPDGVTTTYTYDAAHRLTDITDANGARIHYTLDPAGNRTHEQVLTSTGTVTRSLGRTFNPLGRLTALTDGLNRTVFAAGFADSYDGNGNLVHSQDGLSVQQKQSYDGLNRLMSTIRDYQGTNSATANTQSVTSFDALDRVTGFSDPDGLNTTYDIDVFGNITGLHSPDTGTTTKTYDVAGNLISTVDANQVTTAFTYDALGRPTGTTYPDTTLNVAYHYDESDSVTGCTGGFSKGHLTRVVESNGGIVYCYDGHGNVIKKQQTVGSVTTTTSYAWTLGDRLESITTANGAVVAYSRDANGRITTVTATPLGGATTTIASNVAYQPFGPIASYTLGNGQTVTRTYDANGQLTDIASAAFSLHLGRDAMGNVAALGDSVGASPASETYGYDSLYRLTGVNGSSGNSIEAYTYNKTGDRLSKAAPGLLTGAYSYQPGTHRLVAVGTTMRQVDARGNTTANVLPGGTFGYGYNQRNRLTVVQKDGVTVGSYVLNALGQRVQKTVGSTSTRFDYDEASQLLSEITGGTARDYVWLDNLPIGIVDRSGSTMAIGFIHADGLGSPRAVTDDAGAVQWKWTFASNPFGENIPVPTSGYTLNLRFPGQYFDTESGLNYNINRDYEAASGRYLQSDPLGIFSGQANTYAYIQNNPLRGIDPLGLAECGQGHWVQVGSDMLNLDAIGVLGSLISNNVCRCVWLWVNTTGPYMWSGDLNDSTLTRTRGVPVGMSGDPSLEHEFGKGQSLTPSPSSCICSPPPPKG